ncbi:hypothetical protein ACSBOB_23695 [Mesorhizobium sp. ASY16-5R]|uniref:hypothetical protein n=1 Tax=Mesorhizobium sp. ASY16-5R TaxID=3445772 RepID=UPI003FA1254D
MRLTLDDLIRTLRMQAQQLADDVEFPRAASDIDDPAAPERGGRRRRAITGADDDAGRG